MLIGIMTMHRVPNYGSFLQAYALKRILETMGHRVVFLDFEPGLVKDITKKERLTSLKGSVLQILSKYRFLHSIVPKKFKQVSKGIHNYHENFLPRLKANKRKVSEDVDVLLIGSDEVFNCTQRNLNIGFSEDLFGANFTSEKIMTYAASFGNTTYEALLRQELDTQVKILLERINYLSFRDRNSQYICTKLTQRESFRHIDPALLYSFDELRNNGNYFSKQIKFAILYSYSGRMNESELDAIRYYCEDRNLKLYCFSLLHQNGCDLTVNVDPISLFSYFENAECVITDTFHGTILSIITKKPFLTFVRTSKGGKYGNEEKLNDLLENMGLEDRCVGDLHSLAKDMDKPIDYLAVDKILAMERKNALTYLDSCLSEIAKCYE